MERTFVYAPMVSQWLKGRDDAELTSAPLETEILKDPDCGDIVEGTGGVHKFRLADPKRGKGKRGGLRIFYLDLPHVMRTHVLFILEKGQSENVTKDERELIKSIVLKIKKEASK